MEVKLNTPTVATPDWIAEIVSQLSGKITNTTQFVCKYENQDTFGKSDRDEELVVQMNNSESVKTTEFSTDGEYKDGQPVNYKDGYVKNRTVTGWNWCLVENVVKGTDGQTRVVTTCFVKNKQLYFELRRSVGLSGY